jgi:hypothetical protein
MRVLVLFGHPERLCQADTDSWARDASIALVEQLSAVAQADLVALAPLSQSAGGHDWMLDMRIAGPDGDAHAARAQQRVLRDFLGDLRLLGTRPRLMVADEAVDLATPPR